MNPVKGLFKSFLLNQVTVSIEGYRFRPKQFQIPTFLGLTFLRDTNQWIPLAFQATSHQVPGACCVLWCLNPPKEGILPSKQRSFGFPKFTPLDATYHIFFWSLRGQYHIVAIFGAPFFMLHESRQSSNKGYSQAWDRPSSCSLCVAAVSQGWYDAPQTKVLQRMVSVFFAPRIYEKWWILSRVLREFGWIWYDSNPFKWTPVECWW